MKIPLFKISTDKKDITAINKVIRRGTQWAIGPEIEQFEKELAIYNERQYALCFNSGTSALHTLLLAYDIKDKEVIVPSFTFIATVNAIVLAGGIPVFAEVEKETYALDVEDVKRRITKNTKIILPIHYGGMPARDIIRLRLLAERNHLILIEDNAEAMGARIADIRTGCFGSSAILSFCQNKIISTGEGGAIITDDESIYKKCKLIRSHGRVDLAQSYFDSIEDNDYTEVGYNYRMPTMCAALGLSQLKKISTLVTLRRVSAKMFNERLKDIKELILPQEPDGYFSVYQMYTIRVKNPKMRLALQTFLLQNGIMSKVYFNPVHTKTFYSKNKKYYLPVTEELSRCVLTLPFYPNITKKEIDYICKKIKEFFRR